MGFGSNGFWLLFGLIGCSFQIFLCLASEKVVVEFFFGLLFFNYRFFMKSLKKKKKKSEGTSFWPLNADHLWTLIGGMN